MERGLKAGGWRLAMAYRPVLRWLVFLLVHLLYRVRFRGRQHFPAHGPAIVVCNHVSFMDALVVGGASPRPLRFLMDKPIFDSPWLNWWFRLVGAIPVDADRRDPGSVRHALAEVSRALRQGEVVMVFPEGRLTPNGEVQPFRRGFELILARDAVPVVQSPDTASETIQARIDAFLDDFTKRLATLDDAELAPYRQAVHDSLMQRDTSLAGRTNRLWHALAYGDTAFDRHRRLAEQALAVTANELRESWSALRHDAVVNVTFDPGDTPSDVLDLSRKLAPLPKGAE